MIKLKETHKKHLRKCITPTLQWRPFIPTYQKTESLGSERAKSSFYSGAEISVGRTTP